MGIPVDMTLSGDGSRLYLLTRRGLTVFTADASSGKLSLAREIVRDGDPENPFFAVSAFHDVALNAQGDVLFVVGKKIAQGGVFDAAVAAFDVSGDPPGTAHLHTLTGMYFETDPDAGRAWNHLMPGPGALNHCETLVPHAGLAAVDVFCAWGFFVVRWDPQARALKVTDFAVSGTNDRFGNRLAQIPVLNFEYCCEGRRQMAQDPEGAHVYLATAATETQQLDAIHVFERRDRHASGPGMRVPR